MKWFAVTAAEQAGATVLSDSPPRLHNAPDMTPQRRYMRPLRWLAFLPLAALPLLAAIVTEQQRLERTIAADVAAALAAAGQGWAKPMVSGRDVEIRGVSPDRAASDAARRVTAAVFGVRRVDMRTGAALP